ncbi:MULTISPECIES: hypothetical protein [unclassified Streptomyces]|uniref:hypothetical protein n=1 Tax=unclassified Streptomyces TaxID=2593676 RepID=UPI0007013D31|nr:MULTISPECIES: hypothetical protein [unclassified Streptomyces]KQX57986.1 hypothetical protein ASD33_26250 [Streptomyces sp. Root1304]KRA95430.1 hypothetical protein ASE09_28620 [Streptomyces sp. Root66D1]
MLNRIRRAIRRTRERYAQTARHRGALTPTRPTLILPKPSNELTLFLRRLGDRTDFLAGEETALVRPYVLAGEQRTRQSSALIPHHLLAHTCFVPAEAQG